MIWQSAEPGSGERLRWQVRSTYLMLDLIHRARRGHLPPVSFTIGNTAATLLIRCYTRAEWTVWVHATGVDEVWPERTHGGCLHLHTAGRVAGQDGSTVTVGVIADPTEDDEPLAADAYPRAS
jgi:hypothetical protein